MFIEKRKVKVFKRIFDIVFSVLLLLIFSPVFFIIIILVRFNLGSPVLFKQVRPGKDGIPFTIFKFRTMTNAIDRNNNLLPDMDRQSVLGNFLRNTSLDEIPELINILKGEMSFVGPRPLLVKYLDLYNDNQARRHDVKPGITGLAQVNGRNAISWDEKFKLDVSYVDEQSFVLDMKILLKTIVTVVKKEGINSSSNVTMEEFKGN